MHNVLLFILNYANILTVKFYITPWINEQKQH